MSERPLRARTDTPADEDERHWIDGYNNAWEKWARYHDAEAAAAVAAVRADLAAQIEADQYVEDDATWTRAAEYFAAIVRGSS